MLLHYVLSVCVKCEEEKLLTSKGKEAFVAKKFKTKSYVNL